MTITQMKYFLEVAKRLNFTVVAQDLFVTQPTLSRQIINMENELNTQLFVRSNNSISLTPAGQELFVGLEEIYQQYTTLAQRVESIGSGVSGELTIGISEDQTPDSVVVVAIDEIAHRYQNVGINILRCDYKSIRTKLMEGSLDIVNSMTICAEELEGLEYVETSREAPCFVIEKNYPLPCKEKITSLDCLSIFKDKPLLLPSYEGIGGVDPDPLNVWLKAARWEGAPPRMRFVPSVSSLPLLVTAGLGAAVVNQSHILSTDSNVVMREMEMAHTYSKIVTFNPKSSNPLIRIFMECVRVEMKNR